MKVAAILFTAFLHISATSSSAEARPEPTPQQIFDHWLSAYNSGELQRLQTVIASYKMEHSAQRDIELRSSMGPWRLLEMRSSTPSIAEAIVSVEASERSLLVTVKVDESDPGDVTFFQIEGVETPAAYLPKRLSLRELRAEANQRLDALAVSDALSGALLVSERGRVLYQWWGGFADRQATLAITPETRFRIASLNKMFTAVAVLQLVREGKLSLNDSIRRHLPDYPDPAIAESITIRQLLNHTSGLGDIFGDDFSSYSQRLKTHSDYIAHFGKRAPEHAPGAQDGYSNYGYVVLGAIIEAVSGESYYDYIQKHIYAPAGMTSTGSEPESSPVAGRVVPYTKVDGRWQVESVSLPWRGTAAGGGYSTIGDLQQFGDALLRGELVSTALLDQATSAQNHKQWYGYGFMVSGNGAARQFGHEGGALGANAAFVVIPSRQYVVIGLSNNDPDAMENAVNFLTRRLPLE